MRVYILSVDLDYGAWSIVGAYSTLEKATAAMEAELAQGRAKEDVKIEEFEVE